MVSHLRSRAALHGATRVGEDVRLLGWPHVVNAGELVLGRGVVLVSTPAPIALIVGPGASLVVGDGTVLESGASIRARRCIRIGRDVRIGAGAILDDDGPEGRAIDIGDGAWIADGALVIAGSRVAAGAIVPREGPSLSIPREEERSRADRAPANGAGSVAPDGAAPVEPAVAARVRAVVSRIVPSAAGIEEDAGWTGLKGWDSLAALRVLVALEKEFAVVLPSQLLAKVPTLASVAPVIAASVYGGEERGHPE